MKRIISLVLCAAAVLTLAGCGTTEIALENHEWKLEVIQSSEDGTVIACGPECRGNYPDATVVDVECSAAASVLAITDRTNAVSCAFRYQSTDKDGGSILYDLTGEDGEGMAVTSLTTYGSGEELPTLVITLDGYTLYFQANE